MRIGCWSLPALAASALLAGGAADAAGQAPEVDPGGVATVVLAPTAPAGADTLRFTILPAPGVRLFARPAGVRPVPSEGAGPLALTFGIPAEATAGEMEAARVVLDWGVAVDTAVVAVGVRARRAISFELDREQIVGPTGRTLEMRYRIRNRGNARDTIRLAVAAPGGWEARLPVTRHVLAAGDTASGLIQLLPPARAAAGDEELLSVTARSLHVSETRIVRGVVVGEESWAGGLAQIPGQVFIGSSTGLDAPGVSLTAAGMARPGTRVALDVRHADGFAPPAFRGALSGPRLRLAIDAPDWDLRLGDVFTTTNLLVGPVVQGRGLQAGATLDSVDLGITLARPSSTAFESEPGHVARATAAVGTRWGRFGLEAASVERGSAAFAPYATLGGGLTYTLSSGSHRAQARVGMLSVESDSGNVSGLAAEGVYALRSGRDALSIRLRRVPAVTPRTASVGNEAFLTGNKLLGAGLSATGWAFSSSSPILGYALQPSSRGGAAGLRGQWAGRLMAQLLGSYRESGRIGQGSPTSVTRSVRGSLDVPVGQLTLELDADAGTISDPATRDFLQARTGARWTGSGQWAWVGITHFRTGATEPQTSLDATGSFAAGRLQLQGGLNLRLDDPTTSGMTFWSAAAVPLGERGTALNLGVDHRRVTVGSDWRISLGISQAFGMPLPVSRNAAVEGVLFEDLDGDGVRDPDEPAVPGIRVLYGPLARRTGPDGAFRFFDAMHGSLRIDPASLPPGMVVPASLVLPSTGTVAVPLIRTASLQLRLFLDRDSDDEMDTAETWAGGIVVSLRDRDGRDRDGLTDDEGRLRFGGVVPGQYTLVIRPRGTATRPAPPVEIPLLVEPGAAIDRVIAVPLRTREIRIRGS